MGERGKRNYQNAWSGTGTKKKAFERKKGKKKRPGGRKSEKRPWIVGEKEVRGKKGSKKKMATLDRTGITDRDRQKGESQFLRKEPKKADKSKCVMKK